MFALAKFQHLVHSTSSPSTVPIFVLHERYLELNDNKLYNNQQDSLALRMISQSWLLLFQVVKHLVTGIIGKTYQVSQFNVGSGSVRVKNFKSLW